MFGNLLISITSQVPPFTPAPTGWEATVILLVLFGYLLVLCKWFRVPIMCMLSGFMIGIIAFEQQNAIFFPWTNLLVILASVYTVYTGLSCYQE